jgi:hypothetical protein
MSFNQFGKNVKQESGFDEEQRLMCFVSGCHKRWTVHVSGDKPKCSEHQWGKQTTTYSHPTIEKSVTQSVRHWNETEDF